MCDYLKDINEGKDIFHTKIKPQMKTISAKIFQGNKIAKRNNTFEVFGIDFMIDERYKVWLIEININPYLGRPNQYIKVLLPNMIDELLRIVVDPYYQPSSEY